ncbi:MAG: T9SS type A sorting domain-containing protein [Bacteroidales bacterium]|nr:T9SS type A sorting domain-containing protein [Bacteroidales bacterium]
MNNKLVIFAIIFLFGLKVNAQEYLSGFSYSLKSQENVEKKRSESSLRLPFFDDFTATQTYPDAAKWQNRNVFINSGFPLFPTNFNAATLDAIDATGKVYPHASSSPFVADSLISKPISLINENGEKLTPADSLYFSFYYQPQGNGDAPESNDSLVLMFGYVIDTFRIEYDTILIADMFSYMQVDTIHVGDILYHDMNSSCNQDMYAISENQYTLADSLKKVAVPCDTVFYSEMVWNHIWSTEGMSLDSFLIKNDNQYFKQVMIPVKDEAYFKNDIVVLFYNYATMPSLMYPNDRSNVDCWNIDFVYFDKNRSCNNTSYPLVTFSEKSPSLLKRYQSMPYRQYKSNPTVAMATDYQMYIANLDSVGYNTEYSFHVENMSNDWTFDYTSDVCYLSPFANNGFQNCNGSNATQACPHLNNFLFEMDNSADTASFVITHIISVETNLPDVKGDTLREIQRFSNYYAYDDGTPERGYGVVPDDSYFATQFSISMPDTLCGVQLLFNRTHNDANYDFFDIVVWNDNNGKPGNEYYRLKNQRPVWDEEEIYKFAYYPFDKVLKVNGIIYVGIMQHSRESINIGFDTSTDNQQYNFFETGDGWENSIMKGSLMIRPVFGNDFIINEEVKIVNRLGLYPVPSKDVINISELPAQSCEEIIIFDMTGRLMKHFRNDVNLDISDLSNGLYMIRVVTDEGKSYTEKFVISK